VCFDRVIASGLARALETAELVVAELDEAPRREIEQWLDLRELRGGRLRDIPEDELEDAFLSALGGAAKMTALDWAGRRSSRRTGNGSPT
jgi:probable phosphoglycerate mutase